MPVLAALELFGPIEALLSGQHVVWYTACSFTGALPFVSASLLENEESTESDAPESGENVGVVDAFWVMFVQVAKINAILVSVLYPAADMRLYQLIDKPVTPVTILMLVSYIPAIAVTARIGSELLLCRSSGQYRLRYSVRR